MYVRAYERLRQRKGLGLLLSGAVLCGAITVRFMLPQEGLPFITVFPAVVVCAVLSGIWAGAGAALIGGFISWFYWFIPNNAWAEYFALGAYGVGCIILLAAVRLLQAAIVSLAAERDRSALLFRELQHRVANNLQLVSALLARHRREIRNRPGEALEVLKAAEHRINILGRIHRKLTHIEPSALRTPEYLHQLCEEIVKAFGRENVLCDIRIGHVEIAPQQLSSVAMLLFELLTNSFKHAFPNERGGKIIIRMDRETEFLVLTYEDTGPGLPEDFDPKKGTGLGTKMIETFSSQLGGAVTWGGRRSGLACQLRFPVNPTAV